MAAGKQQRGISIKYMGEVPHEEVRAILAGYDLFLLPSRGESFGHTIFEALSAGRPVAIGDLTPWGEVESAGAGWVIRIDDSEGWQVAIESIVRANHSSLDHLRVAARRFALARTTGQKDTELNRELLLAALAASLA